MRLHYSHTLALRRHGATTCAVCEGEGAIITGRSDWSARERTCWKCDGSGLNVETLNRHFIRIHRVAQAA